MEKSVDAGTMLDLRTFKKRSNKSAIIRITYIYTNLPSGKNPPLQKILSGSMCGFSGKHSEIFALWMTSVDPRAIVLGDLNSRRSCHEGTWSISEIKSHIRRRV